MTSYPLGIKENAVAIGGRDGSIDILRGNSLKHVRSLRIDPAFSSSSSPITSLRFSCNQICVAHLYAGNRAGELVVWDLAYGQSEVSSEH